MIQIRGGPKNAIRGRTMTGLAGIVLLSLVALRGVQIWANPNYDFDTSSIVLAIQGGFDRSPADFVDIAHPGLLAIEILLGNAISQHLGLPPMYYWVLLVGAALCAACVLLFMLLRKLGCSTVLSLLGCSAYLLSPAIANIATRSEENILFHFLYILSICAVSVYMEKKGAWRLAAVSGSAVLLAMQHTQPFVIVSGGLCLFCISEFIDHKRREGGGYAFALRACFAFVVPGVVWSLRARFFDYPARFYSMANNDSVMRYLRAFLLFAQGYVITGSTPRRYTSSMGLEPTSSLFWLGLVVVAFVLLLSRRRRLVDLITFAALGFVILYEPSSSERWDTLIIAAIISVVPRFVTIADAHRGRTLSVLMAVCVVVLAANVYSLGSQFEIASQALKAERLAGEQMHSKHLVYADMASAIEWMNHVPRNTQFGNLTKAHLKPGDMVFLGDGGGAIENGLGLKCHLRPANLCRVYTLGH